MLKINKTFLTLNKHVISRFLGNTVISESCCNAAGLQLRHYIALVFTLVHTEAFKQISEP